MNGRRKTVVLMVCLILVLISLGVSFAWYLREDIKRAESEKGTVMAPYNLYLLKPNAKDSLQFAVGNLHPGEIKQTVICVSNRRPDDYAGDGDDMAGKAKESEFGYELMLAHTENLAVTYEIYPLIRHEREAGVPVPEGAILMEDDTKEIYYWTKEGSPAAYVDHTQEMRQKALGNDGTGIVNAGAYVLYDNDDMKLKYEEDSYEYDYYLVEIKWLNTVTDFEQYKKETDMVYVIVNAKQPRPTQNNNP